MFSLSLIQEPSLFVLKISDRLTVADGRQAFLDLVAHPDFDTSTPILVHVQVGTDLVADFVGIFMAVQSVKAQILRFGPESTVVILAVDGGHFGTARMLEQIVDAMSQLSIRVVSSPDDAAEALGLELEALVAVMLQTDRALPQVAPDA